MVFEGVFISPVAERSRFKVFLGLGLKSYRVTTRRLLP